MFTAVVHSSFIQITSATVEFLYVHTSGPRFDQLISNLHVAPCPKAKVMNYENQLNILSGENEGCKTR